MLDFAARNGLAEGDELVAYYLTVGSNRGDVVGSGLPRDVCGVEVLVTKRTDSFLTRTLGWRGWRIERGTAICLEGEDTPTFVFPRILPPDTKVGGRVWPRPLPQGGTITFLSYALDDRLPLCDRRLRPW